MLAGLTILKPEDVGELRRKVGTSPEIRGRPDSRVDAKLGLFYWGFKLGIWYHVPVRLTDLTTSGLTS